MTEKKEFKTIIDGSKLDDLKKVSEEKDNTEIEKIDKKKFDEINDKYLRLCADFENLRRRTSKEIINTISTANKNLILDILPVLDDFERYFTTQKNPEEGITIIYTKLKTTLEKTGLKEIKLSIGDNFDSEKSEAITKIKSEKSLSNKIVDIVEKGYKLKDSIIRFAKVIIGE